MLADFSTPMPVTAISGWQIALIIILVVLIGLVVGLYFFGKRLEKQQKAQKEQMDAMAQTVSILVIDKKYMKFRDANLPKVVVDQTPKYMRRAKMPFVKAKVGPKVMTLIADQKVFDILPVKQEAKVVISGLYITEIKSVRGGIPTPPPKKKGLARFLPKKK